MRRITIALLFAVGAIGLLPESANAQILPWRRDPCSPRRGLFAGRLLGGAAAAATAPIYGGGFYGPGYAGGMLDTGLGVGAGFGAPGVGIGTGVGTNVGV